MPIESAETDKNNRFSAYFSRIIASGMIYTMFSDFQLK